MNDVLLLPGKDCAEQFVLADAERGEVGSVMVLDDSERLVACSVPYDSRVAGVISGASEYQPALILGSREMRSNHRPIALMGRVFCKVDAAGHSNGRSSDHIAHRRTRYESRRQAASHGRRRWQGIARLSIWNRDDPDTGRTSVNGK